MSDQQDNKPDQAEDEGEISTVVVEAESKDSAVDETPAPVEASSAAAVPVQQAAPAARKGSSAIAWLALVLVLGLGVAAGWSLQELRHREAWLMKRLADVEEVAGRKDSNLDALGERWQSELQQGMGELSASLEEVRSAAAGQADSMQAFDTRLAEQRAELARYGATDRKSWLYAEAEYLLRLANQRLIMAGDTTAAQALLSSADNILRELDDVGLHQVRGALAADLAAVRAVPTVDVEGIYLRLAALAEQTGKLVIFQLPEQEPQLREASTQNWQGRLRQGYEDALAKLSDYIIIRRRDVPMQALMDPQWEGLVRQNLRMLLEQAQVALLSGNQTLYRESLERAQHWVAEFFESDEAASRAMAREITQLSDLTVAVSMPDISKSLRALDDAIQNRPQQGGDE